MEDQERQDGVAEEVEVEQAFDASTVSQSPPSGDEQPGTSSSGNDGELGVEMEALAFVAGYVARKCRTIDPSLGMPISEATPGAVPDRWLRVVSRGGLTVPSGRWMELVKHFELIFCLVMGATVDSSPGIIRRLSAALAAKDSTLDQRVIRKLVSTRLHIRIKWLNMQKDEAAAKRRSDTQKRQHACSAK